MTGVDDWVAGWVARLLSNRQRILRYMWIPQALAGAILLWVAYGMGHDHFHLIRAGVRAPGLVVGHEQQRFGSADGSADATTAFMPVVEFSANDRVVRFRDWLGSASTGGGPDRVTVLYDPSNPSVAMIDRQIMNWVPWAPIGAVGLFLGLVAIKGWLSSS